MATRTLQEIGVQAWVASVTGITTIYSNQKGPRPIPLPYASILELTSVMTGGELQVDRLADGLDGIERVSSRRQGNFSIQIYGDGHTDIAQDLLLSTGDDDVIQANAAAGITIAYVATGPIRLSRDSDGVTEDRTLTEYAVRWIIARDRAVTDIIDTVEANEI